MIFVDTDEYIQCNAQDLPTIELVSSKVRESEELETSENQKFRVSRVSWD